VSQSAFVGSNGSKHSKRRVFDVDNEGFSEEEMGDAVQEPPKKRKRTETTKPKRKPRLIDDEEMVHDPKGPIVMIKSEYPPQQSEADGDEDSVA
jgi:hypothetical protein